MKTVTTIAELNSALDSHRTSGESIGFVPTMGYLHDGHISLVEAAIRDNDIVVMSIFVNPTQFAPGEDYKSYPRDPDHDSVQAGYAGVDVLFMPEAEEIYPDGFSTYVNVDGPETSGLDSASRPGHFRGVATVVAKLFNIVRPNKAYFGQKDAQQLMVIRRMTEDLNFPVEIIGCPIVREADGIAMSSRNKYLSAEERDASVVLYQSLVEAARLIDAGERSSDKIATAVRNMIAEQPRADVEYVEIRTANNSVAPAVLSGEILIAVAVWFGKARLIDNIVINI